MTSLEETVRIRIKKLNTELETPKYAKKGDAGLDLRSVRSALIKPGEREILGTGIAIELPYGYAGFVQPRSGLAAKHGLTIVNTPGLIDSGYRGEICVIALNTDKKQPVQINRGDRIAQLVIQKLPVVELELVDELSDSERASSGFGSSGV